MKIIIGFILLPVAIVTLLFYKRDIPVEDLKKKYADTSSQFMSLMGMEVHYRIEGNLSDSLPIVLLHGTSSSLHTWDSLVLRLQKDKRIIRMDLPAFGLTGPNPERDYSIAYYNRFVDSFLTRLAVNKCIVGGNSLGGGIAWNQALKDTQRVKGIILINSVGYPRKNEKGNIGFKLASMRSIGTILSKFTPRALIRKSLEDVYSKDEKINEALIDRYYELLLRKGNRQATLDLFSQRKTNSPELIRSLSIPALIIWGEDDQLIDVSNAYQFNKDIQASTLAILSQSGHVPMEESPDEVETSIRKWMDSAFGKSR